MTDLGPTAPTAPITPFACATCKFWDVKPPAKAHVCRRNAPQAIPVLTPERQGAGLILQMVWPTTHASDWCGDYQMRLS